ncbi:DUF2382 domain-containing protein [Sphingomonas prati]|uniref:Uncharacterized protein (TIGR02271 family) n=1 Tax=Sphingomonas prati TaxID=1843237 RepID=A0A7W9F4U7_9SPHN|nr:DUF2382 domain-containing protein [Sphingomonas prati]MBB5730835.1 uncharacterized protein (TIGR02271 family) [Sphingomonas prati]GGE97367.1 hypothetical protein GCM10011404_33170 [Sphingomonas prati]
MSRTITAMFDTRADADAGRERLLASNIDADNVRVHGGSGTTVTGGSQSADDQGMWSSIKNAFLPDEDRHTYEEGARRGGFILSADVDDSQVDDAVRVLEDANSVDIDERSAQWKSEGWNNPAAAGLTSGVAAATPDRSRSTAPLTTAGGDEQTLEVVEEQLVVGKRDVDRGGVRVRSYVTEKAVHEQVRLRDESINVERRPVDRAVAVGDNAFHERTIEMTETDEEAVVGKTARVVEEIVVRKTADERLEDINETVRRTDVDVDNFAGSEGSTLSDRLPGSVVQTKTPTEDTSGLGDKAAGLGKEALGNVKQGVGGVTGDESLTRDGMQQERSGEMQQGKLPGDNR